MTAGDEKPPMVGHAVDGIEEFDNPLPGWWVWIFWATIVFSLGYWAYYEHGPGPSVIADYETDVRAAAERAPTPAAETAMSDEAVGALARDGAAMTKARETYEAKCAMCHGPQGQGLIGPNLTDEYWLHGNRPTDLVRTITDGVVDKGMIPWKGQLPPPEIAALAAYIGTLVGSNPPNPKAPQGDKLGAWRAASR
ncbi:MAG TPA: cbb3-type cytochrome c oxidase N-terminal domain-containing protein [Methylomirabilota bacterium]|nr:cbb3-type cytochrome c oxidase N-terminal domain-containing protein [Methylomirabilota bacterium]